MEKRQSVIEQFSSFIIWRDDNQFLTWQTHPRLKRQMRELLSRDPSLSSSQYWVIYWHRRYTHASVPKNIDDRRGDDKESYEALFSYLQEPCYQAAEKVHYRHHAQFQQTKSDFFGMGCLHVRRILQDFRPEVNPNLWAYALVILQNRILDELRILDRSLGSTQWGLLLNPSEKRFRQALERSGQTIENDHMLIWQTYRLLGRSPEMKLSGRVQEPSLELLTRIQQYTQPHLEKPLTVKQIQVFLQDAARAIKDYLSLPTRSLNAPMGDSEGTEFGETLPDREGQWEQQLELSDLIRQHQRISTWFHAEIQQIQPKDYRLNPHIFEMLEQYYGQGLTQGKISENLGPNQSTIARNLAKFLEILASRFIPWAESTLGATISPEQMSPIVAALEQWLQQYFQEQ